jgi:hypothetical protein
MRTLFLSFLALVASSAFARTVVFWQPGFPTISSQPVAQATLTKALDSPVFLDIDALQGGSALQDADLLVLPYGSAAPADIWMAVTHYVQNGGCVLTLGGEPFRIPVSRVSGALDKGQPQDSYARELGIWHTYEAPAHPNVKFAWKYGYSFLPSLALRARRVFVEEGRIGGLGYMTASNGEETAAPVIVSSPGRGSRVVMLDFEPEPGYWDSADGATLIRTAADYARQGETSFWLETLFGAVQPGEPAIVTVHLSNLLRERRGLPQAGSVMVELLSGDRVLDAKHVPCAGARTDAQLTFAAQRDPGLYIVRGTYEQDGRAREFYQNGFFVEDPTTLTSGPVLGVKGDFITRDGKPFFPVGTNYFTTEGNGWDFSGPRNAWVWDRDFADMAAHGVNFVRTGVWFGHGKFVEPETGGANERFLRNLEAFLLCARRHGIVVNFTLFGMIPADRPARALEPGETDPNPYLNPGALRWEHDYVLSLVNRFGNVPWLCWDLINEPSFSNPRQIFHGNVPDGDPSEIAAWRRWLRTKYASMKELASAWSVTPENLGGFENVPLPSDADLSFSRYGKANAVRALDYNLFAQDMFSEWVRGMTKVIRGAGSGQLIDVGQDEGGVGDRVLNQFYGGDLSFTTNHTYWNDDALLWDSVAAKRPGTPNIVGETGYQPVWAPDGEWRYDEIDGKPLLERKWALGFAAGNTGAVQWDWDRESYFGMKRSDGSAKIWQPMMRDMGRFANAAQEATGGELIPPQVATVLPQSFQLSTYNRMALAAQQGCVRAIYQCARAEAYAVGEYQIELLGNPKLIILPSPMGLTERAWNAILDKVSAGTALLVSGPFDLDAHMHPTDRTRALGIDSIDGPLTIREDMLEWPGGEARLTYGGDKTTLLTRAFLSGNRTWAEIPHGRGRILFSAPPLELNDRLQVTGDVYRYALKAAGITPTYTTNVQDPGLLICPTRFGHATLYVLTSEASASEISFRDEISGKAFSGTLQHGRAALLLVGNDGRLVASYNWR